MDMTWILAVIVLAIVVLVLIAVGVKLYERFSRRSGYDEIPAADPQDHYYDEAEEQQYAHGRV
jgi:Tfp pilus assembly major pilin PilA